MGRVRTMSIGTRTIQAPTVSDQQLTQVVDEVQRRLKAAIDAAEDTDDDEMWLEAGIQPIGEDEWLDACNSLIELEAPSVQPGDSVVDDLMSFDLDDSLKHTFQQQISDNSVQPDIGKQSQDTVVSSTSAGDLHVGKSVTSKRSSKWDDLPRRDRIPRSCKVEDPEDTTQDTPLMDVTDDIPQTPESRARVSSWHGTPTQLSPTSASLTGSLQSGDAQPLALEFTPLSDTVNIHQNVGDQQPKCHLFFSVRHQYSTSSGVTDDPLA